MTSASNRNLTLELMRGLAAIVVVVWHSILAFLPQKSGIFGAFPESQSLTGSPFFVLVNGTGAVALFFVLSGYVLVRRALLENRPGLILDSALRRYPRLMLPVVLTVLLSWLFFKLELYSYVEAAAISGSPWLAQFANSGISPEKANLHDALQQGLWRTFVFGEASYDTSLWTMKFEFVGSFLVFAGALAVLQLRRMGFVLLGQLMALLPFAAVTFSPFYACFGAGLSLAVMLPQGKLPSLFSTVGVRALFMCLAFYALGYLQARGVFLPFSSANVAYVNAAGAALLILALHEVRVPDALAGICRHIGMMSFPLYLVHVLVISSAGSAVFVRLSEFAPAWAVTGAVGSGLILSYLISLPLMLINEAWVRVLHRHLGTGLFTSPLAKRSPPAL